ncbi:glycoside hydrolase family 65 protein [Xylanivirga thermophila]|jgi:trehalose/maltose hydrolase-like predicted phosphorylase|uniref:glycoside hydrolase family 65 protein n=1 Tax=Xylanivirga thermophila TaxID=2496273 RepID=UPI001A92F831|nr:glycosyl hydrolase family 65 protein [Xylanivirga thermophila]
MGNILNYTKGQGEFKNWIIEESDFDYQHLGKCESIFCQGNGYMGVRAALEEKYVGEKRNMFVAGTFNKFDEAEVTELPNLPDITNVIIYVSGIRFRMDSGVLHAYSRSLNLKTGELIRKVDWESPNGDRLELCFNRFVSVANRHIIGSKVTIKPLSGDMNISIESGIDGQVTNTGSQHFHEGEKRIYDATYMEMISKTIQSGVYAAIHASHAFEIDGKKAKVDLLPVIERRFLSNKLQLTLKKDSVFTMEKISCVHTSRDLKYESISDDIVDSLKNDGLETIRKAYELGYDALFKENKDAWAHFWREHDIKINAINDYDQLAIRFALYHLNIMTKQDDNRVGIGAKGLSGEGYKGHSFWDTEIFILPYFMFTQPKTARTLLEYRFRNLYGARLKARENGFKGAMYPWESAWIDDGEVTPKLGAADVVTGEATPILTGLIEQHISADIAYAVWEYYIATRDQEFMDNYGYEIIIQTAYFWSSRVEWNETLKRYEINDVIGPDEYKEHVNNNAYTNYLAHYNMKLAKEIIEEMPNINPELYKKLDQKLHLSNIKDEIDRVIDGLYLPKPGEDGIIPQHDTYLKLKHIDLTPYKNAEVVGTIYNDYNMEQINEMQVSKQADLVMLLYLLDDLFDKETKKKNYLFYEERTLHDSSLSKSTHCILANDLGYRDSAYEFFRSSCDIDLGQNMKSSDMGIHSAAMGGIWQCVVMGFGGVRIVGDDLYISPRLPKEWSDISFPLVWRGNPMRVTVSQDDVVVENMGKDAVSIFIYDTKTSILAGQKAGAEIKR